MLTLSGLKTTESLAQNETGKVSLRFEYGTMMNLAYIEANEKIDRLIPLLPRNVERPTVIKSSTADIPMARIQVVPKLKIDLLAASELVTKAGAIGRGGCSGCKRYTRARDPHCTQ
jgi:multidrug efflux pump subunit AcrB